MGGDSLYALKTMTGEWCESAPHLADLFKQVRTFIRKHCLKVQLKWVPHEENHVADAAVMAAR